MVGATVVGMMITTLKSVVPERSLFGGLCRYAQLRALCEDLMEVFSYPELAELEDDPALSLRTIDAAASGKLELLDRLLPLLREEGKQVLLLSHRPRILRMLEVRAPPLLLRNFGLKPSIAVVRSSLIQDGHDMTQLSAP